MCSIDQSWNRMTQTFPKVSNSLINEFSLFLISLLRPYSWNGLNLYMYLPSHSAHMPGCLMRLIVGMIYCIYQLKWMQNNISPTLNNFYKCLHVSGYQEWTLHSHFTISAQCWQKLYLGNNIRSWSFVCQSGAIVYSGSWAIIKTLLDHTGGDLVHLLKDDNNLDNCDDITL